MYTFARPKAEDMTFPSCLLAAWQCMLTRTKQKETYHKSQPNHFLCILMSHVDCKQGSLLVYPSISYTTMNGNRSQ